MSTKNVINASLRVLGLAGLVGITVVAPNALIGLEKILKKSPVKKSDQPRLLIELKRQGLVHISKEGDELRYTITPAGIYRLQKVTIDEIDIKVPKKWDKKWRLVTFDIPVRQSSARTMFVKRLQSLGFMMLQRSLWIHPAPCLAEIEQIASYYNVKRYCVISEIVLLDEHSTKRALRHFSTLHT